MAEISSTPSPNLTAAIPSIPVTAPIEPIVPPAEIKPVEDKFSSKFAALTRKEKEIRERDLALKSRESKIKEWESEKKLSDEDPFAWIEQKLGKDAYQKWTQRILKNNGQKTVEERVEELQKKLEAKDQSEEQSKLEQKQKEEQALVEKYHEELATFLQTNSEKYELLNAEDSPVDILYKVVEEHYKNTGKILSNEEAADAAEKWYEQRADKQLQLKKIQQKVKPITDSSEESSKQKSESLNANPYGSKTLTNLQASEVPTRGDRKMTDEESKAYVAANFVKFIS